LKITYPSRILNSLIGAPQFQAGLKYTGSGLTPTSQEYLVEGLTFMDTPGMSDPIRRRESAAEITSALKRTGLYYLTFIITTEDGMLSDPLAPFHLADSCSQDASAPKTKS
jgi:hypothetical protein